MNNDIPSVNESISQVMFRRQIVFTTCNIFLYSIISIEFSLFPCLNALIYFGFVAYRYFIDNEYFSFFVHELNFSLRLVFCQNFKLDLWNDVIK